MIVLPSGIKIVASTWRLTVLLRFTNLSEKDKDAVYLEFRHPRDLLSYCDLFRHYDSLEDSPAYLIPARQSPDPPPMPKGTVDEPLGVTGANWREFPGGWSPDDAVAIAAWLGDDNLESLFAGEWKSITRVQAGIRRRLEDGPRPTPAPPTPREIARLEAIEARARAIQARHPPPVEPPALPFDWRSLPADDFGRARISFMPDRQITVGGRPMWIHDFHQYATYAGLLCGAPHDPEHHFRDALATARRVLEFPDRVEAFVVLPRIRTGHNHIIHWSALPPVTTAVRFCDGGDEAFVIWFQDDYGLPTDAKLLAAISAIGPGPWFSEWSP